MRSTGPATRRLLPSAVAAAVLWVAGLGLAPPTAAAAGGPCPGEVGVTVVVDFSDLGGGVAVACAPGESASGLTALTAAGFEWEPAQRFASFVCRIEGQPSADPCVNTPPASAYWTYWVASRGGPWCYSSVGAASRRPPAGSVEGWAFAKDRPASNLPAPRLAAPEPSPGSRPAPLESCPPPPTTTNPPPPPTPDSSPPTTAAAPPVVTHGPATANPAATGTSAPTGTVGASTTSPGATRGPPNTASSPSPSTSAAAPTGRSPMAAPTSDDSSSPIQLILVGTLLVAAGVAAAAVARRRRHGGQTP